MSITSLSSRELNHDVSRAKKAAKSGPVVITDRGKPSHVLMTYSEFVRLTGKRRNLVDALSMLWFVDDRIDPPRAEIAASRGRSVLKYLLDTNVVSELRKVGDGKADANVT